MMVVDDDNGDDDDDDDEDDADDDDDDDDDTLVSISHQNCCRPYLFYIRFKGGVRADWRRSGCVVMVIVHDDGDHRCDLIGDAEDA